MLLSFFWLSVWRLDVYPLVICYIAMGNSTISMVIFHSYVKLPEGYSGEAAQ